MAQGGLIEPTIHATITPSIANGSRNTELSNVMNEFNYKNRLEPKPTLSEEEISTFESALQDANTAEELKNLLQNRLGIDEDHLNLLIELGGAQKLRQFWYEVIKFDLTYGTLTSSYIPEDLYKQIAKEDPNLLAAPDQAEHGVRHRSSLTSVVENSLSIVNTLMMERGCHPEKSSFFDLGCGEGKAVLIAAKTQPHKKVTGIDYLNSVLEVGKDNVTKINDAFGLTEERKGCISFVFADAAKYEDYNGLNVVYMYNPFHEEIIISVEENLRRCGGKVYLIYNKPEHAYVFERKGWKVEQEEKSSDPDKRVKILSWGVEPPEKQPGYTPPFQPPPQQLQPKVGGAP